MKKHFSVYIFLSLLAFLCLTVTACSVGSEPATGPNQVHMNETQFTQSSITIHKGERITLVNDVASVHIIENGTWDNQGNARPRTESGAPNVDFNIDGGVAQSVGPFTTAGTFKLYCTVHPGMNLTVIVK